MWFRAADGIGCTDCNLLRRREFIPSDSNRDDGALRPRVTSVQLFRGTVSVRRVWAPISPLMGCEVENSMLGEESP